MPTILEGPYGAVFTILWFFTAVMTAHVSSVKVTFSTETTFVSIPWTFSGLQQASGAPEVKPYTGVLGENGPFEDLKLHTDLNK